MVKIGAQDEGIQKALDSLGKQAATVEGELARLGKTPVGREVIKSLEQIEAATKKVTEGHQRMADRAVQAARGMELVGGASKLTGAELNELNRIAVKGIDAFQALGKEVPASLTKMAEETKKATNAGGGFTSFLGKANSLLGAFGIGLSVGALVSFGRDIANAADALTKMHDKTGITVEGLQQMQIAGDDAGVSLESMTSSVNMLQKRLGEGDKSAVAALKDMGIELEQFKSLDAAQQMSLLSKAVQGMDDPLRVAADLSDLFGRSWAELLPVLKRGFKEVDDGATVMSAGTVKALDDAGDAAGRLYRSFKANLGEALADILTLSLSSTRRLASELASSLELVTKQATAAVPKMAQLAVPGLPKDLDAIERALTKTATASIKAAEASTKAATASGRMATSSGKVATTATVAAEAAKKFNAEVESLVPKVRALEGGLFQIPDALQKIGRGYDESKLSPLVDAIGRVEQKARIANFGFAGMTDALKGVGIEAQKTADEIDGFARFEFSGPIQQVTTFGQTLKGVLAGVPQMVANAFTGGGGIVGALKGIGSQIASTLGNKLGDGIKALGALGGPLGAAIGSLAGPLIGMFGKLFTSAEKQINPLRQTFVDMAGGLDALNRKAAAAGVTLTAMLNAKNPEAYKKAIDELNAAFQFQADALAVLDETAKRYGFTIEELGPAMARQELDKQAQGLFKDWQVLNAAGIDTVAITSRMAESVNAYVKTATKMGVEVPAAMKPMLQAMIDQGLLTDAAGNKIENLEDSGITFAQTMSEGFKSVVDEVKKLAEAITRSLGGAINGLPTQKKISIDFETGPVTIPGGNRERDFAARGGLVTETGIQRFASGGRVLPFLRRGTDTVPAMLTPGEIILNEAQQSNVASAITGSRGGTDDGAAELVRYLRGREATESARLQALIRATVQTTKRAG